jgi:hypothetical protein
MTEAKPEGWIIMRRRVSLAGRVSVAGAGTASGGTVTLTAVEDPGRSGVAPASHNEPRRYDTRILGDGFYFFLNLPSDRYLIGGRDELGHEIESKPVSIPLAEGEGRPPVIRVDLVATGNHEPTGDPRQRHTAGTASKVLARSQERARLAEHISR